MAGAGIFYALVSSRQCRPVHLLFHVLCGVESPDDRVPCFTRVDEGVLIPMAFTIILTSASCQAANRYGNVCSYGGVCPAIGPTVGVDREL